MRIFLHVFLPLIMPLIIYAIWAKIDAKRKGRGLPSWEEGHWFWFAITGFVFASISFIYLTTLGEDINKNYHSPRIEDGQVVPGHYK